MRHPTLKLCAIRSSVILFSALPLTSPAFAQTSKPEELPVDLSSEGTYTSPPVATPVATPVAPAPVQPPVAAQPVVTAPPAPPPAPAAKNEPTRDGFYLRSLTGFGAVRLRGTGPNGSASIEGLGSLSNLAIGGSLMRGLVLAGTLQAAQTTAEFKGGPYGKATIDNEGKRVRLNQKANGAASQIGVLIDWYPMLHWGLHTGLSLGLGAITVVNQADDKTIAGNKFAGTLFVGYDWSISPSWALGLELLGSRAGTATLKKSGSTSDSGYEMHATSFGLAASILYY